MNGAELPCGSVLRVERARSSRDSELEQISQTRPSMENTIPAGSAATRAHTMEETKECALADPELEDFFDSL